MRMKTISVLLTCLASLTQLPAQLWETVGGGCSSGVRGFFADSTSNLLYVVGAFQYAGDSLASGIATWDGATWGTVGHGKWDTVNFSGTTPILSVEKYGDNLFAGGMMEMMAGDRDNAFLSRWDGQQWNVCGNPNAPIYLNVANGRLFALGGFSEISGRPTQKIAVWDGLEWVRFGDSLPFKRDGQLSSAAFYNGEYYFTGHVKVADTWRCILRWTGSAWDYVDGRGEEIDLINDVIVYKGQLFVGGWFFASAGNPASYLMAWDGSRWYDPFPNVQFASTVNDLQIIDDELYIAGGHYVFDGVQWQGQYQISRYNGQEFCSFGGGDILPLTMEGYNGSLFVGCQGLVGSDRLNYIAKWIGGNATDICISQPVRITDPATTAPLATLSPNPTQSQFTLTLPAGSGPCTLQIHDLSGRVVLSTQRYHAGAQVDVAALAAGLYFVEVQLRDRTEVLKLVKE